MAGISVSSYSFGAKVLTCLFSGGCIAGFPLGASYGILGGVTSPERDLTLTKEGAKEKVLKDIEDKKCYVTTGLGQEENKFGAIYICPVVLPTSRVEEGDTLEAEELYYLEEESVFDALDSSKSPMSLFKKVSQFQYKKEGDPGTYYLFLDLGDGIQKKIPVDNLSNWNLFSGFSIDEERETLTEVPYYS